MTAAPPVAAAPPIAAAPISWGVIEVPDWGLQLDPGRVLGEMKALGVGATEFGPDGFLPADPAGRASVLGEAGLVAVGGFFPVVLHDRDADPLPAIERELEAYAAAGAETLVLSAISGADGYEDKPQLSDDEWDILIANLDRALAAAERVGVVATLHPHLGTVVEAPAEVQRVVDRSRIGFCLDTGHLTIGGGDPLAFVREHAGRVTHVHLKDVSTEIADRVQSGEISYRDGVRQGMYRPLGTGDARVAEIIAALREVGYDGWYVLEQDTVLESEADAARALADARTGIEFIRREVAR